MAVEDRSSMYLCTTRLGSPVIFAPFFVEWKGCYHKTSSTFVLPQGSWVAGRSRADHPRCPRLFRPRKLLLKIEMTARFVGFGY